MELAMQINSNDQRVRNETVKNLEDFNSRSLSTLTKEGEQLVSLMPSIKKTFDLLGDDIIDLITKNDALTNKIGSYDERRLDKSEAKLLKQIDDEKRANLIMSRMKKQIEKP